MNTIEKLNQLDEPIECKGLVVGDRVRILSTRLAQGYCGVPEPVEGRIMTVEGVNYDHHWIYGPVDGGGSIGISTFFVERVDDEVE